MFAFFTNARFLSLMLPNILCPGLLHWVVPEQPAKPQSGVGLDTSGQLPQALSVQHRDVGCQAVTQQGHLTLLAHTVHPTGKTKQDFYHANFNLASSGLAFKP